MTVFLDHFLYNDHTISSNLSKHQHNVTTKIQISPQKRSKVSADQAYLSLYVFYARFISGQLVYQDFTVSILS